MKEGEQKEVVEGEEKMEGEEWRKRGSRRSRERMKN